MASRSNNYRQVLNLLNELGKSRSEVKRWAEPGATNEYWIDKINNYNREIKNRRRNADRAIALARLNGLPLKLSTILSGSTYKQWVNELGRLRSAIRRRPVTVSSIIEGREEKKERDEEKQAVAFRTNTFEYMNGTTRTEYEYKDVNYSISMNNIQTLKPFINNYLVRHKAAIANNKGQIQVSGVSIGDNEIETETISSAMVNYDNIIDMFVNKMTQLVNRYQSESFDIKNIKISFIKVSEELLGATGSAARSIEQADKQFYIVNPTSKYNCLYQAIAVCRNYDKNQLYLEHSDKGSECRIERGKQFKALVKPSMDNYADNKSIQEISDYTAYPIVLYNNLFQVIKRFTPAKPLNRYRLLQKEYSIQKVGDHCLALIRKEFILKSYPEFEFKKIEKKVYEPKTEDKLISKKRNFDTYNEKIAAWDIETSPNSKGEHISYACSIAWNEYKYGEDELVTQTIRVKDKKTQKWVDKTITKTIKTVISSELKEQQFWGLDCLQRFSKFVHDNKDIFNGYTLYAHNGGKYDLPLCIKKTFIESDEWKIEGKGCVELNNAWIGFKLKSKHDNKYEIKFRDSCRMLPMSLDKLTRELKVPHQKLTETVKHSDITLLNYMEFPQLITYLTHDVFGLLEVIMKFGRGVFDDLKIDITKCFTGASLAKKNFFKNMYNPKINPMFSLSDKHDNYIRDSYFGGRVEVFQMGRGLKCYYYDFTSLYPDVGRMPLPYGKPEFMTFESISELPEGFFGWVECEVRTKNRELIPKHAVLKDMRLIFPIIENWTAMNLFSEELDFEQYEYKFTSGVKFKKAPFLDTFFTSGFVNKAKAKKADNPAMAQAYKIIINSGYGFWGLRTKDRDGIVISDNTSNDFLQYLNTDKLISMSNMGDYTFCRVLKDMDVTDFNVSVAAAISSYARSKLHSLLTAVKQVGGKVFYCDTDSIICDINLTDHPELKKKFQWDGNGDELGSLKNEADDYVKAILKKLHPGDANEDKRDKMFAELVKKEDGNLSWDERCITGCKQYALKKTINIEGKDHFIEINKCKGYSQKDTKLCFDDMVNLNLGNSINQEQTQFRCPKSNYVSETIVNPIKTKKINKKFRQVYTKGTLYVGQDMYDINARDISPLII